VNRRPDKIDHAQIREMLAAGASHRQTARALGCGKATVTRVARAATQASVPERPTSTRTRTAAAVAASTAARLLRPAGIISEPGSRAWFDENQRSWLAGLAAALAKDPDFAPCRPTPNHSTVPEGDITGDAPMMTRADFAIDAALAELGAGAGRDRLAHALGAHEATSRLAPILRSDIAREFPDDALALAMNSELSAAEVLALLRRLRPAKRDRLQLVSDRETIAT